MSASERGRRTTQDGSLAAITAILDRPLRPAKAKCECKTCAERRAKPFACADCGYEGEPSVWPCECPVQHPVGYSGCDSLHGHTECPVCEGGDEYIIGLMDHMRSMVRDIRGELRGAGLITAVGVEHGVRRASGQRGRGRNASAA